MPTPTNLTAYPRKKEQEALETRAASRARTRHHGVSPEVTVLSAVLTSLEAVTHMAHVLPQATGAARTDIRGAFATASVVD